MNSKTNSNEADARQNSKSEASKLKSGNGAKALLLTLVTFAVLIFALLVLTSVLGFGSIWGGHGNGTMAGMMAVMMRSAGYGYSDLALFLASANTLLLLYLLYQYFEIYLTVKNEFTLYLILFASTLLVYSITANPLFYQNIFGFMMGGGPFVFIPLIFTIIATLILIYMSNK